MGIAAPLGLLGLLLLAPVIAMYLLKRRREEVLVSSVYLWEQVVQDIEANAPWQRLRRNLLLLLQLLFLLLATFGLARPFLKTAGATGQSLILVIDSSISMGAEDGGQGTRLETARAEALRLMEGLPDNGRVTVIRAGDGADIMAANSDDLVAVRAALAEIEPLASDSDLGPALTLAAAAAARQADSEIVILSDGAVQLPPTLAVERPVRFVPIGSDANNQAISALNLSPREGGYDLFVQVTNYGPVNAERRLVVTLDDEPFTASDLAIPAGQQTSKIFPVERSDSFRVEARLEGDDPLPGDDHAWAVPGPAGTRQVRLMTASKDNRFVRVPFQILVGDGFSQGNVLSDTVQPSGEARADLLILDRWLPDQGLPGTTENLLILAPPAGNDVIQTSGVITNPFPLKTGYLPGLEENLFFESDLFFVEARRGEVPPWGTVVLEDSSTGAPLLWVGEQGGRRVAVLNLVLYGVPESITLDPPRDVVMSNLVYQPTYPVLIASLADYLLAGPAGGLAGRSLPPGQAITLPLLDADYVEVETPGGEMIRPRLDAGATTTSYVPLTPGIYAVRWEGSTQPAIAFTVNLFVPTESAIAPSQSLSLATTGGGAAGTPESGLAGEARLDLWQPLLLLGLIILALEWLVYQKDAVARARSWLRTRRAAP
ncbi:MAG: VWA domain-containing protein [Ardenticatenales bacterium]|nr:VWA domain-containing protein [Ardenticatenales bacterium]